MLKKVTALAVFAIVFSFTAMAVVAQDGPEKMDESITGLRADAINQLEDAAGKYLALAKAMPDDKLSWRPGEGIRSSTEVWMHVANANFLISKALGAEVPADLPKEMEKVTDRNKILHYVELSFKTAGDHIKSLSNEDLGKEVNFFGQKRTAGSVIFQLTIHAHNHLGQCIAYARTNGVKPPWAR